MGFFSKVFGKGGKDQPPPAMPGQGRSRFQVGDRVQWPGQGLGRVERLEGKDGVPHLLLQMDSGMAIGVPVAKADSAIWPLPTREQAQRLKALLLQPSAPDPRPFDQRHMHFMKTITDGSMEEYVAFTCSALAAGEPRSFGEKRLLLVLEDNVFAPIAEALAEDKAALVQEVTRFQRENALEPRVPTGAPQPSPRAPELPGAPRPEGYDYLGTFDARGALVVGDPAYVGQGEDTKPHPSGAVASKRVETSAAKWHAYVCEDEDGEAARLAVVRDGTDLGVEQLAQNVEEIARVWVDGGRVVIADAAHCSHKATVDGFLLENDLCVAHLHGCMSASGGDGTFPVRVARDGLGAAYVEVEFE